MTAADRFERRLVKLTREITAAAVVYEARWTLAALRRVDPGLGARLDRQIALWGEASREGDEEDVLEQGEALCRGYAKAYEIMGAAGVEDDAYHVGRDDDLILAIGPSIASAERVREVLGESAVFLTPDEAAGLLRSLGGFETIAAIKRAWPGAVVERASRRAKEGEAA